MAKLQKTSQEKLPSVTVTDVSCTTNDREVPLEAIEIAKILARIFVNQHLLKISKNDENKEVEI